MGHAAKHHGASQGADWPKMFFVPIPMAMFGMLTAFMFGANVGIAMGRKQAKGGSNGDGHDMMAWKHKMAKYRAMKGHHHHGDGPACTCSEPPAEQAKKHHADSSMGM